MKKTFYLLLVLTLMIVLTACDLVATTPAPGGTPDATGGTVPAATEAVPPTADAGGGVEATPADGDQGTAGAEALMAATWQWQEFQDSAEENDIAVSNPSAYTIVFQPDGVANIQADCNTVVWSYLVDGSLLSFNTVGPSTLVACGEGSLDQQFLTLLGHTATYVFTEDGRLALNLMADAGNMLFSPGAASAEETSRVITPEQISLDVQDLPYTWQAVAVPGTPYDESQPPGPMGLPDHIQIQFTESGSEGEQAGTAPIMYIIPVNAYRQLWESNANSAVSSTMAAIEAYVNTLPSPAPTSGTPVLPYEQVTGANDLAVKFERTPTDEESATRNGYRFVGRFMQGPGPVINGNLQYMYIGFTSDGQYLIAYFQPVINTTLPSSVEEVPAEVLQQIDTDNEAYLAAQAETLNASAGADWQPGLASLDALIASLSIDGMPASGVSGNNWLWAGTRNPAAGTETLVENPEKYQVSFNSDGALNVVADCNVAAGAYTIDNGTVGAIRFEVGPTTLAACAEGSRSADLLAVLPAIQNFRLRAGGQQLELIDPASGDELLFTLAGPAGETPVAGEEEAAAIDPDAALKNVLWQWEGFEDSAGENDLVVPDPAVYTLFFADDGTFQFQADCNVGSGSYRASGGGLTMELGPTTLAECGEESLYNDYLGFLSNVATYVIQDGKLYLNLIADAGNMVFGTGAAGSTEEGTVPAEPPAEETPAVEQPTAEPPSAETATGLTGVVWQWTEFQDTAELNNLIVPNPANYTLQFNEDGSLNLVADCNTGSTTYVLDGNVLTINMNTIAITRAMCAEDSLDTQFLAFLNDVRTMVITEDGQLVLNLFADAGNMLFANGGPAQQ